MERWSDEATRSEIPHQKVELASGPKDGKLVTVEIAELPHSRLTGRSWFVPVTAVLLFVVCSFLAYVRIPADVRGVVWAEDGRFFLAQRYELGVSGSLFDVYQGYLQFVPRLVTDLATWIAPLSSYGVTVTRLVCLVTGAIAALVFVCSRDAVSSMWARAGLALITVLTPSLPFEVLGNSANIHWLFLWLAPWLLLFRPTRWWQSVLLAVVSLVTVLTEIQALLFLPLFISQFRNRKSWPIGAALLLGGILQIAGTILSPRDPSDGPPLTWQNGVLGFIQNVLVGGVTGSGEQTGFWLSNFGWGIGILFAVPFALAIVVIAARSRASQRAVLPALVAGATVPWIAGAIANAGPRFLYSAQALEELESVFLLRYGVVPSMFLLALVVVAADRLLISPRVVTRTIGAGILVLCVAVQLLSFDPSVTRRDSGPHWESGFSTAVDACLAGASETTIPTAPESWDVTLSCSVVMSH